MRDFGKRQLGWAGATLVLLGLLGVPEAGVAGTGRLLSQWMSRAPRIDGQIAPGEWSEAQLVDLGAGVTLRIGNDARTLYLAILDSGDPVYTSNDSFELLFDDEGGVPPILDDGAFGSLICHPTPDLGEGRIDLTIDQNVTYQEIPQSGFCPDQSITDSTSFQSALRPEGVTYEAAIPLDGAAPLQAGPGERFGALFRIYRDGGLVACLPNCTVSDPPDYRNLVLASGGCNTGPQGFGAGLTQIGLPLDWTSEITTGGGQGWIQSTLFADPVFCQDNVTGGSGAAACVANALETSPHTDTLLRMPLSLSGQTSATLRLRAVLQIDPNGFGAYDYLSLDLHRQDTTGSSLLFWLGLDQSGTVVLPLPLAGSPPIEFWLTHSTALAGGIEGGIAQVDDVELLCGPVLFADGFESGLTTHWSATTF